MHMISYILYLKPDAHALLAKYVKNYTLVYPITTDKNPEYEDLTGRVL